jgi:hypothetical protein
MGKTDDLSDEQLLARYQEWLKQERAEKLEENARLIDAFIESCATKGIELKRADFDYVQTTGIVAKSPGLLFRLIGEIPVERDGVLPFKTLLERFSLKGCQEGYLNCGKFLAMAHPYFRRGFGEINNFAPRFIEKFWTFPTESMSSFIALDEDRVRINVDGLCYFEADTWYGAQFSEDVASIPPGVTKLRPPPDLSASLVSFFFANAYALNVKWNQEGNIKTFQALELKTEDVKFRTKDGDIYPARYIHAEYDLTLGAFRHFDGAVQLFTEEDYFWRRDSDFNYNAKNAMQIKATSKKLFKFNGRIETSQFVDMCCHFFAANPLSFEYFEGKYPEHVTDAIARIRARNDG